MAANTRPIVSELGACVPTTPRNRAGIRTRSFSMLCRLHRAVVNMAKTLVKIDPIGISGILRGSCSVSSSVPKPNTLSTYAQKRAIMARDPFLGRGAVTSLKFPTGATSSAAVPGRSVPR